MTSGFILNNQLTDFSATPTDGAGAPIANRVAAGKRPRSSMAPTLVFKTAADGTRGDFYMATGSPGGSTIIQYVVKTLVGALDWGLDAQQATSTDRLRRGQQPDDERRRRASERRRDEQRRQRSARHRPARAGPHGVGRRAVERHLDGDPRATSNGAPALTGGADPRREGVVLGDTFTPVP